MFVGVGNFILGIKEFGENFAHNQWGTICTLFLELLRGILDGFQMLVNSIQTLVLNTARDVRLAYSYERLAQDGESNNSSSSAGNRDMYTNVSEYISEDYVSYEGQKYIYVDGDYNGFTMDTEIPVIPIDIYNLGLGNISFLDINFLTGNEYHDEDSPWMILRNIAVTIMHITIYLVAGFLLTTLIWHGVNVVRGSLNNPSSQVNHREGLNRFFIAFLMLVGCIVIMALSIFASEMFLAEVKPDTVDGVSENELPIRVNVEMTADTDEQDADTQQTTTTRGYSFSTNFTGYIRYMAQINDVDLYAQKAAYMFQYLLLVITNILGGAGMLFRMFTMLILAILGPIVAGMYALGRGQGRYLTFRNWTILYVTLAAVQVILAMVSRLLLECSIFN